MMKVGMLWLDADRKRPFAEKVRQAASYYREKYGRMPELCLINAQTREWQPAVGKIEVQMTKTVLPSHFWLGMKNQELN